MEEEKTKDEELAEAIADFNNKLIAAQKDIDPDIQKVIDEHFWELI